MAASIATIVEGHGEVKALPVLLRRLQVVAEFSDYLDIQSPIRIPADAFFDSNKLSKYLEIAIADREDRHLVLLLRDADDECPVEVANNILAIVAEIAKVEVLVVVAKCEYESWFIAAAPSLAGKRGLPNDLSVPGNHHSIRGAKEWLSRRMGQRRTYGETVDQPAFSGLMDLNMACANPSFRRFHDRVLAFLRGG